MIEFFYNSATDSAYNLALEELLTREVNDEIFFLWQNAPAVIIGRNQNTLAEINSDFIQQNKINVTRRNTGGGAVYHDLGNVNYSYIVNYQEGKSIDFSDFAVPVIKTLTEMGINAEFSGRNDILIDNKKISGSAQSRIGDRILFHGTLLFDVNIENLVNSLNVSGIKISGKGIASVRSRVTNIKEHLLQNITVKDFINSVSDSIRRQFNVKNDYIVPQQILMQAKKLAEEKYRTWEWNYGNSPAFNYEKSCKFTGGSVTLQMEIQKGKIINARFNGDFFSRKDVSILEKMLENAEISTENISDILNSMPISEMFLNITAAEILSLFPAV
ncbi:MAG: lipoate--protein ligase [Lentisphaeria bacterium]|nr:lipoate--protein ligase [Lentisphaeria bacterium]